MSGLRRLSLASVSPFFFGGGGGEGERTATRRLELFQGRACSYSAYWSRDNFK